MPVSPMAKQRFARMSWQELQEDMMRQRQENATDQLLASALSRPIENAPEYVERYPTRQSERRLDDQRSFQISQTEDAQAHRERIQGLAQAHQMRMQDRAHMQTKERLSYAARLRRRAGKKAGNPWANKFWQVISAVPTDESQAQRVHKRAADYLRRTPSRMRTPEMQQALDTYFDNIKTKASLGASEIESREAAKRKTYEQFPKSNPADAALARDRSQKERDAAKYISEPGVDAEAALLGMGFRNVPGTNTWVTRTGAKIYYKRQ